MATQYSNKPIVTNGLVYALDFGNQKSYVSGSSTANSLVYNPVPATFQTVPAGDYPGLSAAFSIRKVVSGYTGSAMMIQSASVSQSIGFDSSGNLDTAAIASFARSGTATVKIWYDQSGNNNHATQSTVTNQPFIYVTGSITTLGSKPTLMYSSSGYSTLTLINPLADIRSVFWAVNPRKGPGESVAFLLGDSATYDFHGASDAYISPSYARAEVVVGPFYINSQLTSSTVSRPTESFNAFQILSIHPTANVRASTISQDRFGVYGGRSFSSGVSEVLIYNTSQISSRPLIEENINSYFTIYSPLVGSPIPGFTPGLLNFQSPDALITNQTFPGFSYDRGNSTVMYVGETKGTSSLFTQDTSMSVVSTTSSIGFGSRLNNLGRTYPVTGLKHVTLRFSSGSVDCFVNGIPVAANSIFPTGSTIAGGGFAIPTYTGSLGLVQVYNRPLTGDEIWNNYQLTAPRYGLGALQNKPYTLDDNAYLFLSQSGITDPIITSSINTFVLGLKSASLWDKMIAIYPFVGTGSVGVNLTGSHKWNLKEPSLVTYPLVFTGSWNGSVSGSTPSGSGTAINTTVTPSTYYPNYANNNAHISILSYDTPVSSSILAGTGMTKELAVSTLAGDYGTPAAAYSVRKVRTAYSGALMDVRRDYDNTTGSIGYVSNGDLDTGSLLDFVVAGRAVLPGAYSGLAAAYSLRKVSASYSGNAIDVRRSYDNTTGSVGFDSNGNLSTASLFTFVSRGDNAILYSEEFDNAYWGKYESSVIPNTIIAPNGTLTADTVVFNDANREFYRTITTDGLHTFSMFVSGTIGQTIWIGKNGGGAQTGSLWTLSGGWQRISASFDQSSGFVELATINGATARTVYAWGAQLNSGSVALPYVKTVASTKTNESGSFDTVSTGWVAQWYDQSGNARHATQTATGSQPLIVSSGSLIVDSNKPALRFDGFDDYLLMNNLQEQSVLDQYFVTNTSDTQYLYPYSSTTANGSKYGFVAFSGSTSTGLTDAYGTPSLYANGTLFTGSNRDNVYSFLTGSKIVVHQGASTLTWPNYTFGFYSTALSYSGSLQELIAYTSSVSSSRTFIENNINTYYNVYTSSNAGYVARWYDQSGNNRHATQTATGSQPLIVNSGSIYTLSGKPAISSSQKQLNLASTATFTDFSFFTVTKKANSTNSQAVLFSSNTFGNGGGDNNDNEGTPVLTNGGANLIAKSLGNSFNFDGTAHHLSYYQRVGSTAVGGYNGLVTGSASGISTANVQINSILAYPPTPGYFYVGLAQELIFYSNSLASNRQAIEYGINNYYNIYPQTSSFSTSSFTIYATTSSISASINNDLQSGIASSGPLGFITVSRTGSNSLTLARNGVTSSFAVPASGALSTNLYLGAINNNGLALGSSPYNISFASVGVGLTNNEVNTYYSLVDKLQFNLGRQRLLDIYPGALAAYSVRKLRSAYTGSAIEVQSGTVSQSIGFDSRGNLDTAALLAFAGSGNAFVKTWFDQAGNNNFTQTNSSIQPQIVSSGSILTQTGVGAATPAIRFNGSSQYLNCTETTVSTGDSSLFLAMQKGLGETNILATANGASYYYLSYIGSQYYGTVATSDPNRDFNVTSYGLISVTFNFGNELKFYRNNSLKITRTSPSIGAQTFNRLCGHAFGGYGAVNLNEIVIYPTNQISNRIGINSNINNYYQVY